MPATDETQSLRPQDQTKGPPQRIEMGEFVKGRSAARVGVVEFSDFECPFYGRFARETFPAIARRYVESGDVRYGFRHFPIESRHPNAFGAAAAANCSGAQGKFWEMHHSLFRLPLALDRAGVATQAKSIGLDLVRFEACLGSEDERIRRDLEAARELRLTGTPSFLFGLVDEEGRLTVIRRESGAIPVAAFSRILDTLLKRARPSLVGRRTVQPTGTSAVMLFTAAVFGVFQTLQAQQRPVFRSETVLVPVDVRVLDRNGRPVENLTAANFAVYEDDVRQAIAHFAVHSHVPASPDDLPLRLRTTPWLDDPGPPRYRVFAVVLGRGRLDEPAKGIEGLVDLIENRLMPQDWVTVIGYQRATDLTRDRGAIVRLLQRYRSQHNRIEAQLRHWFTDLQGIHGSTLIPDHITRNIEAVFSGPDLPTTRQLAYGGNAQGELERMRTELLETADPTDRQSAMVYHTIARHDLETLYAAIEYLRPIQGEKHLIFMTEAAFDRVGGRMTDILSDMAADARVTLSTIQTGGLPTSWTRPAFDRPPQIQSRSILQAFGINDAKHAAAVTGGITSMYRRAIEGLRDLETATRTQYVLAYHPTNTAWDGRRRRVRITVNVPGTSVHFRRVYFANRELVPTEPSEFLKSLRISTAAAYRGLLADIPLEITTAQYSKARRELSVKVRVDLAAVTLKLHDDRRTGSVDVLIYAGDSRERLIGEVEQRIDLNLDASEHDRLLGDGLAHSVTVPLSGEPRHVKAIVYDGHSDRLGSAVVDLRKR